MGITVEIAEYLFQRRLIDADERRRASASEHDPAPRAQAMEPPMVSLATAAQIVSALGESGSVLLLGPPGIGKTQAIRAAAAAASLPCRVVDASMLVPEDVLGLPRLVGERTRFLPPAALLPEDPEPFCLFIDELGAASPDVQKALYTLILERRIGEHPLPQGSWVVAAGNELGDLSFARTLSSALLNRVLVLRARADASHWLRWAATANVRADIRAFIAFRPDALSRPPDTTPEGAPRSFSSPRSWTRLSEALDRTVEVRTRMPTLTTTLAMGLVSVEDAAVFATIFDPARHGPVERYLSGATPMPEEMSDRWAVLQGVRGAIDSGFQPDRRRAGSAERFLRALHPEERMAVTVNLVARWGALGAERALLDSFREATRS